MRNAFSFSYSPPSMEIIACKHTCRGKGCGHVCCNRSEEVEVVHVTVTNRDGSQAIHQLRSESYCSAADEGEGRETGEFWGTDRDKQRQKPKEVVRVSKFNRSESFDFGSVSYDDDEDDDDFM